MLSDYQTALNDLIAFKRKHAEIIEREDFTAELSDLEDELQGALDKVVEDGIADGSIPTPAPEYSSVWNKRELGVR